MKLSERFDRRYQQTPATAPQTTNPPGLWTVTDFAQYYDVQPLYNKGLQGRRQTLGIVTPTAAVSTQYSLDLTGNSSDVKGDLTLAGLSSDAGTTLSIPSGHVLTAGGGTISGRWCTCGWPGSTPCGAGPIRRPSGTLHRG